MFASGKGNCDADAKGILIMDIEKTKLDSNNKHYALGIYNCWPSTTAAFKAKLLQRANSSQQSAVIAVQFELNKVGKKGSKYKSKKYERKCCCLVMRAEILAALVSHIGRQFPFLNSAVCLFFYALMCFPSLSQSNSFKGLLFVFNFFLATFV
ncbi:unnamed protein product [Ceratitis capitata]|uniref:(Mediterranean fruit fly) hypothetical protein n=1 Tax=Ceratitis capitata TaxID=7213 RepID=A0A811URJ8_CERCA|nr:unnamed protein product [Ceratitis capitata]